MYLSLQSFGTLPERNPVLFVLENENGVRLSLTDYGARVVSLLAPDRNGEFADVVLGYEDIAPYAETRDCFGATCGRVVNRIANASFSLNGKTYTLPKNEGENCIHGGRGFDERFFEAEMSPEGLRFRYQSPDGEEGFPGNLAVTVTYALTEDNVIRITYESTADTDTPVSLTNHSYFNLDGRDALGATHHTLSINAAEFLPVDEARIPTGERWRVNGTPFDFTRERSIGARLGEADDQLRLAGGYDHCYCILGEPGELRKAAKLIGESGRALTVYTTLPGLQFYTANHLKHPRTAVCLETEFFPNAVNTPDFPSPVIRAGETRVDVTEWRLSNL